ncbi:MAG: serine hydrolase [Patescibacteria group bacterium]
MPPSRRNLIIIGCLCALVIFLAASVRVYQTKSTKGTGNENWTERYLPYAPYLLPLRPDPSFIKKDDPASITKPQAKVSPAITAPNFIPVSAKAYLVGDIESGKIYFEKNPRSVLPVASMSKLITAFVATDLIAPGTEITISDSNAGLPGDTSHIGAGEKMPLETLLYPLLLSSSNVVAEALAAATKENFFEQMSSYAWEVGMPSSYFADASGLSPSNAASARDLFALAQYLFKFRPDILAITRTPHMDIATTTEHGGHSVDSTHPFVNDPGFIGGKTGRTPEAGETMMTLMKVNGKSIAVIILGSQFGGREGDTRVLLQSAVKVVK